MFVSIEMKYKFSVCLPKWNVVHVIQIKVRPSTALLRCHTFKQNGYSVFHLLNVEKSLVFLLQCINSMCITWFLPIKCMICMNNINLLTSVMETQIFTVMELLVGRTSGLNQRNPISTLQYSCGIFGGQSDTWLSFSSCSSIFRCQYNSTNAPYSVSSSCKSYQKDKRAKGQNLLTKPRCCKKIGQVLKD